MSQTERHDSRGCDEQAVHMIEVTRLNRSFRAGPGMQMIRVPAAAGGGDASIIVTCDYRAAAQPAKPYARAQLAALSEKFTGFRLVSMSEMTIDGVSAAVIY